MKIDRFQIYGERASGTNYLKVLLEKNITNINETIEYGWKHYFPPDDFPNQETCLFIVIYRNPYDWVRSLFLQPHHAHKSLKTNDFSKFIRTEWQCIWDETSFVERGDDNYGKEMLIERNPNTNERFKNVLELRSYKIKAFKELKNKVSNIEYVRYEDLNNNPEEFINKLSKKYSLTKINDFLPVNTYKGVPTINYQPKKYNTINKVDLKHINENLDFNLENEIGYQQK